MNYTLKNIKYFASGSQETPCFTANIYEGKKKVAIVENDGHGGCNNVHPVKGLKMSDVQKYFDQEYEIMEMVEDYATATKYQSKAICGVKGSELKALSYGVSIAKMKKSPSGIKAIQKSVKELEDKGFRIINRNL